MVDWSRFWQACGSLSEATLFRLQPSPHTEGSGLPQAVIFIPGFGILNALSSTSTLHQALGIYFLCWAIFTGLLFLAALRTKLALLVVLGLLFLTIAEVTGGSTVTTQIGGWLGIATALVTWYAALADMHSSAHGAFGLPVGPID